MDISHAKKSRLKIKKNYDGFKITGKLFWGFYFLLSLSMGIFFKRADVHYSTTRDFFSGTFSCCSPSGATAPPLFTMVYGTL
jgi:hypothetical protein